MSILDNKDLFASTELHHKEILLPNGTKEKFWFREVGASEFRKYVLVENNGTYDEQSINVAELIANSLVDSEGNKVLTTEQAAMLKPAVAVGFFNVILEINVVKRPEGGDVTGKPVATKSKSSRKNTSGTS